MSKAGKDSQPKTPRARLQSIMTTMLSPRSHASKEGLSPVEATCTKKPPARRPELSLCGITIRVVSVDHGAKLINARVKLVASLITDVVIEMVQAYATTFKTDLLKSHSGYQVTLVVQFRTLQSFANGAKLLARLDSVWKLEFIECHGVDSEDMGPVIVPTPITAVCFRRCLRLTGRCVRWAGVFLRVVQLVFEDCADFGFWPRSTTDSTVPTYFERFCFMHSIEMFAIRGKTLAAGEKLVAALLTWQNLRTIDFRGCVSGSEDCKSTATVCNVDCEWLLSMHAGITTCGLPSRSAIGSAGVGKYTIGHRVHFLEHIEQK